MILIYGFLFMIFFYAAIGTLAAGTFPGFLFMYTNLISLLLIFVPLIFFLLITKNGNYIGNYFKASVKKDYVYTRTELEGLSSAAKNAFKFTIGTGLFCFFLFSILSLSVLGDKQQLGPFLAITLSTITFAVGISYFIFFPVEAWAQNKINITGNESF